MRFQTSKRDYETISWINISRLRQQHFSDNNPDSIEDLIFQFRLQNLSRDIALPLGLEGNKRTNAVPVLAVGQIAASNTAALNLYQTYTVQVVKGSRRTGTAKSISNQSRSGVSNLLRYVVRV